MRFFPLLALIALIPAASRANDPLAAKARTFLDKHCFTCHGKDGKRAGGFGYALDSKKLKAKGQVVAGKLDDGFIVRILATEDSDKMPPPNIKVRPTAAEIADFKAWITAGATDFPTEPPVVAKARPFLAERDLYQAMADYLHKHGHQARFKRFLTLAHLHNDPGVSDKSLRLYHAAVAKLLNSLSWRRGMVLPVIVDTHGAVLAFDLRDLDWDLRDQWHQLTARNDHKKLSGYPYGLSHATYPDDPDLNRLFRDVVRLSGQCELPAVRADWFLAAASLPPLYHDLLNLPDNATDLEKSLGVNVAGNSGGTTSPGLA